jgi:hypothetical protein
MLASGAISYQGDGMEDRLLPGIRQAPRAAFGFELQPGLPTRQELAELLEKGLSKRFGPVKVRYPLLQRVYRMSMLIVTVNDKEVLVTLFRDRFRRDLPEYQREWRLLIDRFTGPVWQVLRHGSERGHEDLLLAVSDEIHKMLVTIPRITRIRWYFKGWDRNKPCVRTPGELPWSVANSEIP